MMRAVITGAAGKIGSAVSQALPEAHRLLLHKEEPQNSNALRCDLAAEVPDFTGFDTVVHLACKQGVDIETAVYNSQITFNVLRACCNSNVKRLIWASSLFADGDHYGLSGNAHYYGGSKVAQEALLAAYCEENASRTAVAMRFGHFDPGSHPEPAHEAVRLDEPTLAYWLNRAITEAGPGLSTWCVFGRADPDPLGSLGHSE